MILGRAARPLQPAHNGCTPSHVASWIHEIGHGLTAAPHSGQPAGAQRGPMEFITSTSSTVMI